MQIWSSPIIEKNRNDLVRSQLISKSNKWILVDILLSLCLLIEISVLPFFRLFNLPNYVYPIYRRLGVSLVVLLSASVVFHALRIILYVFKIESAIPKCAPIKTLDVHNFPNRLDRTYYGPTMFASLNENSLGEPLDSGKKLFAPTSMVYNASPTHHFSPVSGGNFMHTRRNSPFSLLDLALSPITTSRAAFSTSRSFPEILPLPFTPSSGESEGFRLVTRSSSPIFNAMHTPSPNKSPGSPPTTDISHNYSSSQHFQYQCSVVPSFSPAQSMLNDQQSDIQFDANVNLISGPSIGSGGYKLSQSGGRSTRDTITEKPSSDYWEEHKVSASSLDQWALDLRKWFSGTILRRVIAEIDAVNRRLYATSGEEAIIGSTTMDTLQQLCMNKYQYLPTLNTLLTFLDFTKNQGYLVNRLRELVRGGCLEEFRWESGSRSAAWPWKEHLPNDSLILLHLFATYMDHRLPPHPKCLSGRVFTQLHIVRHPDKPDTKSKYNCQLYQVSVQPPHFKLVLNGKVYSFPQGPKNLYHMILMVFHHVFVTNGKIRSISLGPSGLNMAWIFARG